MNENGNYATSIWTSLILLDNVGDDGGGVDV